MVKPSNFQLIFLASLVLFDDAGNSVEFVVTLDINQLELFLVVTNKLLKVSIYFTIFEICLFIHTNDNREILLTFDLV